MYATLKGTLQESESDAIVVEAHGVGYRVAIPTSLFPKLSAVGEPIFLYTTFVLREFSQTLYGFLEKADRDLFEILLEAKGVGPKLALAMLGNLPASNLAHALKTQDVSLLNKIPGIGRKTAERLLVDLRDKVSLWTPALDTKAETPTSQDAVQALLHLGYSAQQAQEAVLSTLEAVPADTPLSQVITAALKKCR